MALTPQQRAARLRQLRGQQVNWQAELTEAIRKARERVAGRILKATTDPRTSRNAGARDKVFRDVGGIYGLLGTELDAWAKDLTARQALDWHRQAVADIGDMGGRPVRGATLKFDRERIETYWRLLNPANDQHLAAVFTDRMQESDVRGLRQALVETLREADLEALTANERQKRLAERWRELAGNVASDKFADRTGRKWTEASYLQMLTRTMAQRVSRESYADTLVQNGFDLARIVNVGESCPICNGWGDVIISLTGSSKDFPSYQQTLDAGMWHPNCDCFLEYVDAEVDKAAILAQAETETPDLAPDDGEKFTDYSRRIAEAMQGYKEKAAELTPPPAEKANPPAQEPQAKPEPPPPPVRLTRQEIEARLVKDGLAEKVDLSGVSDDTAREIDKTLRNLLSEFKTTRQEVYKGAKQPMFSIDKKETRSAAFASATEAISAIHLSPAYFDAANVARLEKSFAHCVEQHYHPPTRPDVSAVQAIFTHEFAHAIAPEMLMKKDKFFAKSNQAPPMGELASIRREYMTKWGQAETRVKMKDGTDASEWAKRNFVSFYAHKNLVEFVAECFTMARLAPAGQVSPYAQRVYDFVKQHRGKGSA